MNVRELREIRQGYEPFKLGIIQSRGVGDAIIAMPIAKHYHNRGHEVHFVIDQQYVEAFSYAFPYVTFHGIYDEEKNLVGNLLNDYWYERPRAILEAAGCHKIMSFPYDEVSHKDRMPEQILKRLSGEYESKAVQQNLTHHLNFDQFKYAVAGVPFEEKWNLDLRRNLNRDYDFFNKTIPENQRYMVAHSNVNNGNLNYTIENFDYFKSVYGEDLQVIQLTKTTDNLFDWLTVLEKAECVLAVDSSYVNIMDQLGFKNDKFFIQRSNTTFTPILREKWNHVRAF